MPLVSAEIEFEHCQGVKFDSSKSKIDWFPGNPVHIQEQGKSISGTLIVGKIKSSRFEKKTSAYKIPSSWKKGSINTYFIARNPQEICPEVFPGIRDIRQSGRCCAVLPHRDICIIPNTIHVVEIINPSEVNKILKAKSK